MTLKDYADFVVKFSQLSIPQSSCTREWVEFTFATDLDLSKLLGQSRWQEFVDAFMKKTDWQGQEHFKWDRFGSQVMEHRGLFLQMLAEFCEPLLVKSAEAKI